MGRRLHQLSVNIESTRRWSGGKSWKVVERKLLIIRLRYHCVKCSPFKIRVSLCRFVRFRSDGAECTSNLDTVKHKKWYFHHEKWTRINPEGSLMFNISHYISGHSFQLQLLVKSTKWYLIVKYGNCNNLRRLS